MSRNLRVLIDVLICIVLLINPFSSILQTPSGSATDFREAKPSDVEPRGSPAIEPVRAGGSTPAVTVSPPKATASLTNTTVITLTTGGFQPPTLTVASGTTVAWFNATNQVHILTTGESHRIYLPLVMHNSGSAASSSSASASTRPDATASNSDLFTAILPPGGSFTHTFNVVGSVSYHLADNPQASGQVGVVPPDPSTIAPPVDQTVATTLISATEFLYTGPNPIQTGVTPGTIKPLRVAVLRGKVLTRDGAVLPGVTISILDHPEFGQTLSRVDGMFDLAVNGGRQVTVKYEKDGYLPPQRQVDVPWQDYVWLPDIVMLKEDLNTSFIDLSTDIPIQVARGSMVSDTRGTRQETLFFPQGTTAFMKFSNGMTQTLTTMHIRTTEYTVGPNGLQAMPAELPPNSAYTYATIFHAEEAVAAGAQDVWFNPPVISYVENFISFTVGMTVPMGYYDTTQGVWVAADSGRVIKILSVTNGKADLDIDGSNNPASPTALTAMGITEAERAKLVELYSVGQSLWRVPVPHFDRPWDKNQGTDCKKPCPTPPASGPQGANPDCRNKQTGSIIGCQDQTLGEEVQVTGTPFSLHYQSDRVPGNRDAYSLVIPITGPDPASWGTAIGMNLQVSVAGLSYSYFFTPTTNLSYRFTWNGRDAYGRKLQGRQPITVLVCYVYPLVYQSTDRFGYNGNGVVSIEVLGSGFSTCKKWQGAIGSWDTSADGLGGWSLNVHHSYDPIGRILYLGDGERRSTLGASHVINTIAGGPTVSFHNTDDGIPAVGAYLENVADVIVGADGSLYLSDLSGQRVRKIDTNGIITTVAGILDSYGYNGDGIPATQAKLDRPAQLALGPDGSLYIADSFNNRIRRISPDGIITTVAGTGDAGFAGDGGPATQAKLNNPNGVAVSPDGSLYIADTYNNSIRRVTTDGLISTVAGTGDPYWGFSGDGGLAIQARLAGPDQVAIAPDGRLYISDEYNSRIRRVDVSGIITTTAGGGGTYCDGCPATESQIVYPHSISVAPDGSLYLGESDVWSGRERVRHITPDGSITTIVGGAYFCGDRGDGGPALSGSVLLANGIAQAPDGTLYVAEGQGCDQGALRKIDSVLPGNADTAFTVASSDGSELYMFDWRGRHLRTVDTLTGVTLYQFGYNSVGLLVSITDRDGNVTTIERDTNGRATGIVGPYGQRTSVTVNRDGYLTSITNPVGEAYHFASTIDGLLTTFTDPRGNVHHFTYDDLGRLIRDDDPAGGYKTLVRTDVNPNFVVTVTSALSRTTQYQVNYPTTGELDEINTLPSGITTTFRMALDATQTSRAADGTLSTSQLAPDPRWGLQAPLGSATLATPGGLIASYSLSRTVSLSDPTNLLSLVTQVNAQTINGRVYARIYSAADRAFTSTTPMGRQVFANLDALGRVIQAQTASLLPTRLGYDSHGRAITMTQGTGNEARAASLSYNSAGYLQSIIDPLGRIARFDYDAAGRVLTQTLPDGRVIGYSYDANGNLASLTPPGRPAHRFTYTPIDLTATYTPPNIGTALTQTLYSYNADRQLALVTRPDGQTINFGYDNAGRLSGVTFARGSYTFGYDPATGNLSSIGAPGGINLAYAFDGPLPISETLSGPITGTVTRAYDNNFFVTGLSVNGADITYNYDNDSLLTGAGNLSVSRDPQNGLITGSMLGNVNDGRSYDGFGEVISYSAAYNGTSIFVQQYSYDKLGRITAKTETLSGTTDVYSYTYDLAGRLSAVSKNGISISNYNYDSNCNRLSYSGVGGTITGTYDAQDRLLDYGTATYNYTTNGELLTKTVGAQTTAYQYDALGNLMAVTLPNGTPITYLVDGRNRRIGKLVNGTLVQGFLYEDSLRPIAELDGNDNVISRFVYGSRSNIPDYMIKGGNTYRIIADQLGSPRLVVNTATGTIVQRIDYDEFGIVLTDTNPGFQPFGFAGGIYDRDTGLVRFGARDYDPNTGRWTAKDPIEFAGGDTNLYGYTLSDPINLLDPNGKDWMDEIAPKDPSPWPLIDKTIELVSKTYEDIKTVGEWALALAQAWNWEYKEVFSPLFTEDLPFTGKGQTLGEDIYDILHPLEPCTRFYNGSETYTDWLRGFLNQYTVIPWSDNTFMNALGDIGNAFIHSPDVYPPWGAYP